MKKFIALFVTVLVLLPASFGCAKRNASFDIQNAASLTVFHDGSGRSTEITDTEVIRTITDSINSLSFSRDKSSKNIEGLGYYLEWYDADGRLIERLIVKNEARISYDGYFYNVTDEDAKIDVELIDSVLGEAE